MSISTDMSGSDELSLDGSESNLIVEAARSNAKKQTKVPSDDETESVVEEIPEVASVSSQMPAEQLGGGLRTLDLEAENSADGLDIGDRATLQLKPNDDRDPVESPESPESVDGEDLDADAPMPSEDSGESSNSSSDGGFGYVAFDSGISIDESIVDASLQSLDIGVESLSLDDSLHLGPAFAEDNGDDPITSGLESAEAPTADQPIIQDTAQDLDALSAQSATPAQKQSCLRVLATKTVDDALLEISDDGLVLGRDSELDTISNDDCLSPSHCELNVHDGEVAISDLGSLNGTWVKINETQLVSDGQEIRMGGQTFRVRARRDELIRLKAADDGTLPLPDGQSDHEWQLIAANGAEQGFCLGVPKYGLRIGRLTGNLVFEDDSLLDGLHAILMPGKDGVSVRDCNSHMGSWVRIQQTTSLTDGCEIMVGRTRLRLEQRP